MQRSAVVRTMQVVRVKREVLAACMSCPLCHKLLREATTISQCLHTFCRKCIFEKINDEEAECCPICQIDLGCVPEEKLRPDHTLEDVRAKIFPYKRKKTNGCEVVPFITLPVRRKERSLSSLVVNTPRMGAQVSLTGRRTKVGTRRASALLGVNPVVDEPKKKECYNDDPANSSSTEASNKMAHSRRQTSLNLETSNHNSPESYKSELWKPLNCLVEVANRTKSLKCSSQTLVIKAEQTNGAANEIDICRTKAREQTCKLKMKDEKSNHVSASSAMAKASRIQGCSRKRKEQWPSPQAVLDVSDASRERRICPVWISLFSSADHKGDSSLPQISASYLRIKEGNLTVSSLKKYLVKKLNLASEDEVEIACRGQLVSPTLSLHELTDQWLSHGCSQRVKASVGSSAKDFIMVLSYSRRTTGQPT